MTKLPHDEVAFEHPAKGSHHCFECVHWLVLGCEIVKSPVMPFDWCNRFKGWCFPYAGGSGKKAKETGTT